jgi:hypothetical protein
MYWLTKPEHTEEEERQEERYNRVRQRLFGFTSG